MFATNSIGMGDPFFCKYICPQGVLEGAIPLSIGNAAIRSALGKLFSFKFGILITVVVLSILFYRPFCKWICPLGAIYSLFNKVSFFLTRFSQKLIVDRILRAGLDAGSASDAFRMIGSPAHVDIHFACPGTLIASDTFAVFNRDM